MRSFCRWHDAGTYDAKTKTGGPNGSIRNVEEYKQDANKGLKIAIDLCGEFLLPDIDRSVNAAYFEV